MPDPRIWAVDGPFTADEPPTVVAPSGLDREAPGRGVNGPFWLEISTEGRVAGGYHPAAGGRLRDSGMTRCSGLMGEQRTLAEMQPEEKNAISHRARALRRLMRAVRGAYGV